MKGLLTRLNKKYAKLPLWGWATVAGGAGWYLLRRRGASSAAAQDTTQLAPPVDAYGASDTSSGAGDLSGVGAVDSGTSGGAGGQLTATPEQFADRGVTSDFQDFMSQLYGNELATKPVSPPSMTPAADVVDPKTGATATTAKPAAKGRARGRPRWVPSRGGEKGHWAYKNGSWAPAPKGAVARPAAPKTVAGKRGSTKPPRVRQGTRVGQGSAGARPRASTPTRPKPKPPAARPRGITKKTAAAKPVQSTRVRPRAFALPGMAPIGGRR